jgi:SOUL heme-binding protein
MVKSSKALFLWDNVSNQYSTDATKLSKQNCHPSYNRGCYLRDWPWLNYRTVSQTTPPEVIEIKQYPPYREATMRIEGMLAGATSTAFNPLFAHISSNGIAMTSPVEARYPTLTLEAPQVYGQAEVSFLYGSQEIPPGQTAQGVVVQDHPVMMVLSLGLSGEYSWERFQQGVQQLNAWQIAPVVWKQCRTCTTICIPKTEGISNAPGTALEIG